LKTFWSQNQSAVERNFAMNSKVMSAVSEKPTLSHQKYAVEKEDTDVKQACYRTNHPELERNVTVNENKINEKNYLKSKQILSKEKLSLEQTFIQKPLPSKRMLEDFKNTLILDDRKKSKLGNTDFLKKLNMKSRSLSDDLSLHEKLKALNPLMIKSPGLRNSILKKTNCMSNENSCREISVCLFKKRKSDRKRTVLGNHRKSDPSTEKSSGGSKIELHNPNVLTSNFSWKRRKPEKPTSSLNEKVLKDDEKKIFLPPQKISQESYVRCLRESERSSKRLKKSLTGYTIRSTWL